MANERRSALRRIKSCARARGGFQTSFRMTVHSAADDPTQIAQQSGSGNALEGASEPFNAVFKTMRFTRPRNAQTRKGELNSC